MCWPGKYPWVFSWRNKEKNTDLSVTTQHVIKKQQKRHLSNKTMSRFCFYNTTRSVTATKRNKFNQTTGSPIHLCERNGPQAVHELHKHIPSPSQGNASLGVSNGYTEKHNTQMETITLKGAVLLKELRNKPTQRAPHCWTVCCPLCAHFQVQTAQNHRADPIQQPDLNKNSCACENNSKSLFIEAALQPEVGVREGGIFGKQSQRWQSWSNIETDWKVRLMALCSLVYIAASNHKDCRNLSALVLRLCPISRLGKAQCFFLLSEKMPRSQLDLPYRVHSGPLSSLPGAAIPLPYSATRTEKRKLTGEDGRKAEEASMLDMYK